MSSQGEAPTESSSVGLVWGMVSAAGYMLANLGLRDVAVGNPSVSDLDWAIWVSANKAFPVVLAAFALVGWRAAQGLPALPPRRMLIPLILTGLLMQWGGNVGFQYALRGAGLALTVPFTFATLLVSVAIVGRLALGDPISRSTVSAIVLMIAAVIALTQGAQAATSSMIPMQGVVSRSLAVAAACLAGIAYGAGGVMMRSCVRGDVSHSATIIVLSTTGMLTLGGTSLVRIGPRQLLATPPDQWLTMLGAGMATAAAFFAISAAYRHLSAVKVNLLNASQTAMSALAGVMLFGEPNTRWLQVGTVLTVIGLILSARNDQPSGRGE